MMYSNKTKRLSRLARAIVITFPTVSVFKAEQDLKLYRQNRDRGAVDWEGDRETFRKVIEISFTNRHRKGMRFEIQKEIRGVVIGQTEGVQSC